MTVQEAQAVVGALNVAICERMPNLVRVRVGSAAFTQLHDSLKAMEYEVEKEIDGKLERWTASMRWSRPGLSTPHYLIVGKPVELDLSLAPDAIAYDGPESM